MSSRIGIRLAAVKKTIKEMESRYRRTPGSVRLIAVSKTMPVDDVREANAHGQRDFGESYAQEAVEKITAFGNEEVCWHFIGPLQKNKTRLVARHFDWVHSIDRLIVAERLDAQRPASLAPLRACIQVNLDNEASKSGVALDEVGDLAHSLRGLARLKLCGLMAIPRADGDMKRRRQRFAQLRERLEHLNRGDGQPPSRNNLNLDTLSMGMSEDLEPAIAEGATMVRVGTAIFGKRKV